MHKREREPQKEKTHVNKTHSARERENDRRDHWHRADRRDQRASQTPPRDHRDRADRRRSRSRSRRLSGFDDFFSRFCLCFEE